MKPRLVTLAASAAVCLAAHAAPFIPENDAVVLERLPARAGDSDRRALAELRARLDADPANAAVAADLADRYYTLARREGDPRYVGYAQAAIKRWRGDPEAPSDILVVRAALSQYLHDFDAAISDLSRVLAREPRNQTALSYRAIVYLVMARYEEARRDCLAFREAGGGLIALACQMTVDGINGRARESYETLKSAFDKASGEPARIRLWVLVSLAEMAQRLGMNDRAEAHYREALALGITDQYLLTSYAEFLLDLGRAREVVELLAPHTRNDVLLLRLALAEKALGLPQAAERQRAIQARIDAARLRQDKLHLSDEARFELDFLGQPSEAARLARENWDSGQHEPSDARILLEAALAARNAAAAQPALAWLDASGHEDPRLRSLAARLREELK